MVPEVPSDWEVKTLLDLAEVRLSNVDKRSKAGEVSVRLCNYMDVYSNQQITGDLEFMQATASQGQVEKFGLRTRDVIITKDSENPYDIGVPAVVADVNGGSVVCGYHLALLRPRHVDGPYLAWALRSRSVNDQFARRAHGTTRFGLTSAVIRGTEVPVPPLPEQRKIAAILSSVDEAISATRKVIEQTERVKQGLLQTLMTRGIGHTRFKQTEIGEIPEAWELVRLGDLVEPVFVERGLDDDRVYRPVVVRRRHGGVEAPEEKHGHEILVKQQFTPLPGMFLISKRQIIHLGCGLVPQELPTNATISKEYLQLRSLGRLRLEFLNLYSRRPQFYRSVERCTYGVDREKFVLNVPWLMDEPVPLPDETEQHRIVEAFQSLDRNAQGQELHLRGLRRLKRGLMQDLLTGRVRVQPD